MVHVYCFAAKSDDNEHEAIEVCERISASLGVELRPGSGEDEVRVHDVRDVAPQKRMFCASFRLPAPVAFA
jgi:tRNA (guanine37-N1)-methyltransferase